MRSRETDDPWQELAEIVFLTKGKLNDFVLAAIKQDKDLDEAHHPAQTYNYHFYQAVILSLPTIVAACETEAALEEKLKTMLEVSGQEALIETWNAKFDKETARKFIKTEALNSYLRLYFRLEKLWRVVTQLKKFIASSKEYDLSPTGFHQVVVDLTRQCKELLAHVQIDAFEMQRQQHVLPIIEFIHFLITLFEEKQLCKIALKEPAINMPPQMINEANSLVMQYQKRLVFTPVNELRELALQMKDQSLMESEKWVQAKVEYAAVIELIKSEIRDKVTANSEQSVEAFLLILEALKKQKIICTNTACLDEFRDLYSQFQALSNPAELSQLFVELSHATRLPPENTERKLSLTERIGMKLGRQSSKQNQVQMNPVHVENDCMSRLISEIEKLSQQYENALENYDIFCRLRQSNDSLDNAYRIAQQWQLANAQLKLIVESALHAFAEMSQLLEGVEKKDPEQIKSFFSRRLPEMSITFGATNATGGVVLLVLNFAVGASVPMISIPLIVLLACLAGVGVGLGHDVMEKRDAAPAVNNHQDLPPAPPPATSSLSTFISSLFARRTTTNSETECSMQERPGAGK